MRADAARSSSPNDFVAVLTAIVGAKHVLTSDEETRRFRTGYRFGSGKVEAVVRPATLVEQWRVLQACLAAGKVVIMQAANTGLTGGSTPHGDDYDRGVVVISTLRLDVVRVIGGGRQVICLPGATLYELEQVLRPYGREPHSVIGSSCIGASVIGGVANNSGGSLVRRGPAYTEMALFARVREDGTATLVNHLGVTLGDAPEAMLDALDRGTFSEKDIAYDTGRAAADADYGHHIRDIDAPSPARYNADPRKLFEASGSAGKVVIFAVRLDTFPTDESTQTFYVGSNDPGELEDLRRHLLAHSPDLPVAGEYIHRDAFNIAETYGKDTFLAIRHLGTDRLPRLFAAKAWVDGCAARMRLPASLSDRVMQLAGRLFPSHLPKRMTDFRDRYAHHLLLKMADTGREAARSYLEQVFPSATGDFFQCTQDEATKAFLHRFAVAGAAVRYRAVHGREVEDIIALDIALRRNDRDWCETLPAALSSKVLHTLYYGHFFCHVFHQDYIVAKGHDTIALEHEMLALLDERGAEYPAEHNVGHLYPAKPALATFYRELDPCNCLNPGIGQTTKRANWGE
jgi:D-lactate dehydrogenase